MKMIKGMTYLEALIGNGDNGYMASGYMIFSNHYATTEHVEADGTFWYWYWNKGALKRAKYGSSNTATGKKIAKMLGLSV
jgi:hypothetical protein